MNTLTETRNLSLKTKRIRSGSRFSYGYRTTHFAHIPDPDAAMETKYFAKYKINKQETKVSFLEALTMTVCL